MSVSVRALLGWLAGVLLVGCAAGFVHAADEPAAPATSPIPAAQAASAPAEPLWELQPYRLSLVLSVDAAAHLPADSAAEIEERLRELTDNLVGPRWQWTSTHSAGPTLRHKLHTRFGAVALADLPPDCARGDKVVLVAVDEQQGRYRVQAREWDLATRLPGAPVERWATSAAQAADEAYRAAAEAFSPLALIDNAQGSKVTLRERGGALPIRGAAAPWLGPGSVLRTAARRLDAYGRSERDEVAAIPWTFLLVQSRDGAGVAAQLHSGIRGPLAPVRRSRTQQLALAVGRPAGPTTLALVSADETARPLAGYDVFVRNPDETTPRLVGRTNHAGQATVPPGGHPLQIVSIKHGEQLLARLPLAPGLTPLETAQLVDDDARLEAEGWVASVQETLVDAVTRRSLLVAQIDARLKAGDNDRARRLLDELRRMPSRQQLLFEVEQHQQRLVANQPQVARQLDRMFGDTKKILTQHLDPRVIDELELRLSRGRVAGKTPDVQ